MVKGGQIIPPKSPVSGAYSVVSRYLSTGYLWDTVRVVGGAYGGFARFSEASGRFVYLSYRDPNLKVPTPTHPLISTPTHPFVSIPTHPLISPITLPLIAPTPTQPLIAPTQTHPLIAPTPTHPFVLFGTILTLPPLLPSPHLLIITHPSSTFRSHWTPTMLSLTQHTTLTCPHPLIPSLPHPPLIPPLPPPLPSYQGYASFVQYVSGEKPEDRQKWRDQVLDANSKDFTNFAEKLKALSAPGGASVVVFGSQVHP